MKRGRVLSDRSARRVRRCVIGALAVLVLPAAAGRLLSPHHTAPTVLLEPLVIVREGQPTGDIAPGTRLDVLMVRYGDPVARCRDMGGEPILYGNDIARDDLVCEGVDF